MSHVNAFANILTPWWTSWFLPDSDSLFFLNWRLRLEVHPFNSIIDVNDLPRFEKFPKKDWHNSRSKRFSLRSRTSSQWFEVKGKISVHRRKSNSRSLGEFSGWKGRRKVGRFWRPFSSSLLGLEELKELKKMQRAKLVFLFFGRGVH